MTKRRTARDMAKARPAEELQIACLELDFSWSEEEVLFTVNYIRAGRSLTEIARKLNREVDEVEILTIHLRRQRRIPRDAIINRCD